MGKKQRWDGQAASLKEAKKKPWTWRQGQTGLLTSTSSASLFIFQFRFFPLSHLSLRFPRMLLLPSVLPFLSPLSGGVLQRFHAMGRWAASLPSAQCPRMLDWHWHTGRGSGVWSLCCGQLAEQIKSWAPWTVKSKALQWFDLYDLCGIHYVTQSRV